MGSLPHCKHSHPLPLVAAEVMGFGEQHVGDTLNNDLDDLLLVTAVRVDQCVRSDGYDYYYRCGYYMDWVCFYFKYMFLILIYNLARGRITHTNITRSDDFSF